MTKEEFINDIIEFCSQNSDMENVKKYSRFFKDGFIGYGLTSNLVREKSKELKKSEVTLEVVLSAMPELLKSGKYEETAIGLLVVNDLYKHFNHETFLCISGWFSVGLNNWAHADTLGMWILPKLIDSGNIGINDFSTWITSAFKFQRRCVPVTFVKELKKSKSFIHLFNFLEPLMMDTEREVQQGMGWFLREAWKLNNGETEDFLLKWKDKSLRLIFQYACEKMSVENKQRFKRAK